MSSAQRQPRAQVLVIALRATGAFAERSVAPPRDVMRCAPFHPESRATFQRCPRRCYLPGACLREALEDMSAGAARRTRALPLTQSAAWICAGVEREEKSAAPRDMLR